MRCQHLCSGVPATRTQFEIHPNANPRHPNTNAVRHHTTQTTLQGTSMTVQRHWSRPNSRLCEDALPTFVFGCIGDPNAIRNSPECKSTSPEHKCCKTSHHTNHTPGHVNDGTTSLESAKLTSV